MFPTTIPEVKRINLVHGHSNIQGLLESQWYSKQTIIFDVLPNFCFTASFYNGTDKELEEALEEIKGQQCYCLSFDMRRTGSSYLINMCICTIAGSIYILNAASPILQSFFNSIKKSSILTVGVSKDNLRYIHDTLQLSFSSTPIESLKRTYNIFQKDLSEAMKNQLIQQVCQMYTASLATFNMHVGVILGFLLKPVLAVKTAESLRVEECPICREQLPDRNELKRHLITLHIPGNCIHECAICHERWANINDGTEHAMQEHPKNILNCFVPIDNEEEDDDYVSFIASSIQAEGIEITDIVDVSDIKPVVEKEAPTTSGLGNEFWNELAALEERLINSGQITVSDETFKCLICNKKCKKRINLLKHIWELHRQ